MEFSNFPEDFSMLIIAADPCLVPNSSNPGVEEKKIIQNQNETTIVLIYK